MRNLAPPQGPASARADLGHPADQGEAKPAPTPWPQTEEGAEHRLPHSLGDTGAIVHEEAWPREKAYGDAGAGVAQGVGDGMAHHGLEQRSTSGVRKGGREARMPTPPAQGHALHGPKDNLRGRGPWRPLLWKQVPTPVSAVPFGLGAFWDFFERAFA